MIAWLWLGCTPGDITTTALPEGRVGDVYSAAIEADGRGRWVFAAEDLPAGLTINPATGVVSGIPRERGSRTVTVRLETPGGRTRAEQAMSIVIGGARPACGRTIAGEFTEAALQGFSFVDWEADGGWRVVTLPVPGPEVEEITFEVEDARLFLLRPGLTLSTELEAFEQADRIDFARGAWRLGWDTSPHLGAFQAAQDELRLIVAGDAAGEWSVATTCAAAPVVEDPSIGPFVLGDPAAGGVRATKYDEEVIVESLDPLPAGLELTERGGIVGVPTEVGLTPLRIRMTRVSTGTSSVTTTGVGVYEPIRARCGEQVSVNTQAFEPGLDERGVPTDVDPANFELIEVPWDGQVGVRFEIDRGPSRPGDQSQLLDPEAAGFTLPSFGFDERLEATPRSWPPARYYQRAPELRLLVASQSGLRGRVTVTCEEGPQPDDTVLPVLEPGAPVTIPLGSVGGSEPITWSAEGLPAAVVLEPDGTLAYDGSEFASAEVLVTLEDADGVVTTTPITLWSTTDACDHVLACGETLERPVSGAAPAIACVSPAEVAAADWVTWVIAHEGLGRPGLLRPGAFDPDEADVSYQGYQGPLVAERGRPGVLFDLNWYEHRTRPLVLDSAAVAVDEAWTICAQCGEGAQPIREYSCD